MEGILQETAGIHPKTVKIMKRLLTAMFAAILLAMVAPSQAFAQDQEYVSTPVQISRDRVRYHGNVYYSHSVKERQTLYAISKAYGVTIEEIYEANPTLNLETEGLKKDQMLLIPYRPEAVQKAKEAAQSVNQASTEASSKVAQDKARAAEAKAKAEAEEKARIAAEKQKAAEERQKAAEEKAAKAAAEKAAKEEAQRAAKAEAEKAKAEAEQAKAEAEKARAEAERIAKEEAAKEKAAEEAQRQAAQASTVKQDVEDQPGNDEYFIHKVKWFEDLSSIAAKYKVSERSIININGLRSNKLARRQDLKIPRYPEKWETAPVVVVEEEPAVVEEIEEPVVEEKPEEEAEDEASLFDIFRNEGRNDVSAIIMLPFSSSTRMDRQIAVDFYSGALLAAKDLGNQGVNIDLSVYDATSGIPVTREKFENTDFAIGPITSASLAKATTASHGESFIISPIDQKVETLADSVRNLIQVPTSLKYQIQDAVNWLKSDLNRNDNVILITQSGSNSEYSTLLRDAMAESGISYSTVDYSILKGSGIQSAVSSHMSGSGTTRIIATSESESFMSSIVRTLYLLSRRSSKIVLYSTARIRTYDTIEIEQLHGLNLHVSASSEVDYESRQAVNFIMAYRGLYNAEPSRFSFQGYDLMKQFSTLVNKYGKRWYRTIDQVKMEGLQTDFNYVETENGGYMNTACKRIVYAPDYTITVVSK